MSVHLVLFQPLSFFSTYVFYDCVVSQLVRSSASPLCEMFFFYIRSVIDIVL